MTPKPGEFVIVRWHDAHGRMEWRDIKDAPALAAQYQPGETSGWYAGVYSDFVVTYGTVMDGYATDWSFIPKRMVISVTPVGGKRWKR